MIGYSEANEYALTSDNKPMEPGFYWIKLYNSLRFMENPSTHKRFQEPIIAKLAFWGAWYIPGFTLHINRDEFEIVSDRLNPPIE